MTEENERMRSVVVSVERMATSCLAAQPLDDDECRRHLLRTLARMAALTSDYLGMAEFEVYDIEWNPATVEAWDLLEAKLPETLRYFVRDDEDAYDSLLDAVSEDMGPDTVKAFEWRKL